ncbi:AAA ATPase domain, partial [Brachionus plicatilis]
MVHFKIKDLEEALKDLSDKNSKKYILDADLNDDLDMLMVITGKNGIGKSRLLKVIREFIVIKKNALFPKIIVRKLDYGEDPDGYDPNLTNHPLVTQEMIEIFFNCSFEKWQSLKVTQMGQEEVKLEGQKEKELEVERIQRIYKQMIKLKNKDEDLDKMPDKSIGFFNHFVEFKKYFKRQILKKICFGNLQQLLLLNSPYDYDIAKINEAFKEKNLLKQKYGLELEFGYKIVRNHGSIVEKKDLNELIDFENKNNPKIRIKFSQLSPGEKLILHLFVIWKDIENIKIGTHLKQTKQLILLDEPDSHCEPNLVINMVKFIQNVLIKELNIQVIMTCHNTTTIFCLQCTNNLYLLKEDKGGETGQKKEINVKLSKSNEIVIRDELASNINYMIDFMNLNFDQHFSLTRDYFQKGLGNSFENLIKLMTNPQKDFSKCLECIQSLIDSETSFTKDQIVFDDQTQKLEDVCLDQINEDKIHVFWPISSENEAWDFMIFYSQQLYLYQVQTARKKLKEQFKKCENVLKRIVEKPYFKFWISSKFFFVDSKKPLGERTHDFQKIYTKEEIFTDTFIILEEETKSEDK